MLDYKAKRPTAGTVGRLLDRDVHAGGLNTSKHKGEGDFAQVGYIAKPVIDRTVRASIARLRDRARFDFARLDVILAGLDSGILTSDVAAELAGVSTFPPEFAETAREWRARKYGALA